MATTSNYHHLHLSFFFLLAIFIILEKGASRKDLQSQHCPPIPCEINGTQIGYPFRTKEQPQSCGRPGFEIICQKNETVLHLPFSGNFSVSDIIYPLRYLIISDPNQCLHKRILKLNLSESPFSWPPDVTRNATYIKCSKELKGDYKERFEQVDCIKENGKYVYVVNSAISLEFLARIPVNNCETVDTVPLATDRLRYYPILNNLVYNSSLPDDRLFLTWNWTEEEGTRNKHKGTVLGISIGGGIIIFITVVLTCYIYRKPIDNSRREDQMKINKLLKDYRSHLLTRYSYAAVKRMTNKFKFQIGKGGYGSVYKGKLTNGLPVAVKVLHNSMGKGKDFINEITTISRIHHVNVVRLLGFCLEGSKRALIYEFMPNESLEKFISSTEEKTHESLGWPKLKSIAIGIARGMEYLHHGCNQRILHLDIKPHNILLDNNFNPKISDFGLAKICSKECNNEGMMSTRGTIGYIAPELFSRTFGVVSYKSDVYSFGMLVLEMVGGRKDTYPTVEMERQAYFPELMYDRVAKEIEREEENEVARKLTIVALWCIQWNPNDRPSMKRVVKMLEGDIECLEMPPKPFVSSSYFST